MRAITLTSAIVASLMTLGFAAPAQAAGTAEQIGAQRQTQLVRAACERSFATARCGTYQDELIKAVANRVSASSAKVSQQEIASRQLGMLIDSVN